MWASTWKNTAAKNQRTGGWRSTDGDAVTQLLPVSSNGVKIYLPDPISSWTELKLYQTNTVRHSGLVCLGRYEKVFKPGSAENMILTAAGANPSVNPRALLNWNGITSCPVELINPYWLFWATGANPPLKL